MPIQNLWSPIQIKFHLQNLEKINLGGLECINQCFDMVFCSPLDRAIETANLSIGKNIVLEENLSETTSNKEKAVLWINDIISKNYENIAIVSHGGIIASMVCELLGLSSDTKISLNNAGFHFVEVTNNHNNNINTVTNQNLSQEANC